MNISFENPDKINGRIVLTVEEADYEKDVEKTLKSYRKKANWPGFRPGSVPMNLIRHQYGMAVKMDTINKIVGNKLDEYISENKIQMLGEPMPAEDQEQMDLNGNGPFKFVLDIAIAPEITVGLTSDDTLDYYDITVDDASVDQQIDMFASRGGHYENPEEYDAAKGDLLKGDLRELDADGNAKDGGLVVEKAIMNPGLIKVEEQKVLFNGAKAGSDVTFNPGKAYADDETEMALLLNMPKDKVGEMTSDFVFHVNEITRYVKGEVNQELFDRVFGAGVVKDEKEFREKVADMLKATMEENVRYKFLMDLNEYMENKAGEITFPEEKLKKIMLKNAKEKGEKYVDEHYAESIKMLKWQLIKGKLVNDFGVKVNDDDLKEVARMNVKARFAQFGMYNLDESIVEEQAGRLLKERNDIDMLMNMAVDRKIADAAMNTVKLNRKTISLDDFNKMMREK